MRLFVGIELGEAVRAAAAASADRLRRALERAAPNLVARWIAPQNLHITIWFIGEVPEARREAIADVLAAAPFRTAAFDVQLAGCGAFPPSGQPRVFWIDVRRGGPALTALYEELGQRLAPLGYLPERRAYRAHLTLARIKALDRRASQPVRTLLAAEPAECGTSRISAITLFRSRLSPRGAAYEPLLRVPLKET